MNHRDAKITLTKAFKVITTLSDPVSCLGYHLNPLLACETIFSQCYNLPDFMKVSLLNFSSRISAY